MACHRTPVIGRKRLQKGAEGAGRGAEVNGSVILIRSNNCNEITKEESNGRWERRYLGDTVFSETGVGEIAWTELRLQRKY